MRVSEIGRNQFAFFTPISAATALSAEGKADAVWIPAAAEGVWWNPRHGEVTITADDIRKMFSNFKEGLHPRGKQELPIDFEHLSVKDGRKPGDGAACGWIQDLDVKTGDDGKLQLNALVEWNDDGRDAIQKKKYKGFSPFFSGNWATTTDEGAKDIGATLLGGALTNYQTIPNCVVTCSMDPAATVSPRGVRGKTYALATAEDLPYSDRESRVRVALEQRFPPQISRDGMGVDYSTYVYPRYTFEDRVSFSRNGKDLEIKYRFNDDLSVTFEGEPYEVVVSSTPVTSLDSTEENDMKKITVKNVKGEPVEIDAASLGTLTLDALAESVPAVAELRTKVPATGAVVVAASDFDALKGTVNALSQEVTNLKTSEAAATQRAKDADARLIEAEITSLLASGRMLPADKDFYMELSQASPDMFRKRVDAMKAASPILQLDTTHGTDGNPRAGGAVMQFDGIVDQLRKDDPKLDYASAVLKASEKNPDLARARNNELSVPVRDGISLSSVPRI